MRAPEVEEFLKYFEYKHLPKHLQPRSQPFYDLANTLADEYLNVSELMAGLRKLLEAKDCIVRAAL